MSDVHFKIVDGIKVPLTQVELDQIEKDREEFSGAARALEECLGARARAYPPAGDALDALAKWAASTPGLPQELDAWAQACMSIKAKYPKP